VSPCARGGQGKIGLKFSRSSRPLFVYRKLERFGRAGRNRGLLMLLLNELEERLHYKRANPAHLL
jgi:hypothetical protein